MIFRGLYIFFNSPSFQTHKIRIEELDLNEFIEIEVEILTPCPVRLTQLMNTHVSGDFYSLKSHGRRLYTFYRFSIGRSPHKRDRGPTESLVWKSIFRSNWRFPMDKRHSTDRLCLKCSLQIFHGKK